MTSNPLSMKLSAVELLQKDGHRISQLDRGLLMACRRSNDPELIARAETVERIETARARKRAQAKRARALAKAE